MEKDLEAMLRAHNGSSDQDISDLNQLVANPNRRSISKQKRNQL